MEYTYGQTISFADKVPELLRRWRLLGTGLAKKFPAKRIIAPKGFANPF
jgi:hypothetical protein